MMLMMMMLMSMMIMGLHRDFNVDGDSELEPS